MSAIVEKSPAADVDSDEEEEVPPLAEETKTEEPPEVTTLASSDVVTKYQEAARIVNATVQELIALCVPGASLLDICRAGDNSIESKAALIFRGKSKGKPVEKGVAFPVCISVNECVCHYSPLLSEDKLPPLAEGDLVKIDLGAHVDGYIAVSAHTLIVGHTPNPEAPVTGARADVLVAAWTAAEVAARLIKAGNTNAIVTEAVKKVAETYGVKPILGTVMHEMKRFVIDGKKMIALRQEDGEERLEACTFETYEVYSIDVAMSSGEGRPRQTDIRTTVLKRNVDRKYGLKVKASRFFFNEVNKRFPTMPFTLRSVGDETAAKMGVRECVQHELLTAYPVLYERPGDQVAHVKFTVLLLPSGTVKITGAAIPEGLATPDKELPEELQQLLGEEDTKNKKKLKKKLNKKKKAGAGGAAAAEAEGEAEA